MVPLSVNPQVLCTTLAWATLVERNLLARSECGNSAERWCSSAADLLGALDVYAALLAAKQSCTAGGRIVRL